jgi:dTDP-4-dehydrorhamnose reductase
MPARNISSDSSHSKTILIIGAGSAIGRFLARNLSLNYGTNINLYGTSRNRIINPTFYKSTTTLDLQSPVVASKWFELGIKKPIDLIVFCASLTLSKTANRAQYYNINALGIERVINSLKHYTEIRHLLYLSTMAVYDTSEHLLREDSRTSTISDYGASKLAAEQIIRSTLQNTTTAATILRLPAILCPGSTGNFVSTWIDTIRNGAEPISISNPHATFNAIADARVIYDACRLAIEKPFTNITTLNIASADYMTVREFATATLKIFEGTNSIQESPPKKPPQILCTRAAINHGLRLRELLDSLRWLKQQYD